MFDWSNQTLLNSLWQSLVAPLQDWINQHPLVAGLVAHPLWLLAAVLLTVFLAAGLLRAVAGLTEQFWLLLLKLPIWGVQASWRGSILLLRLILPAAKSSASKPASQRLSEVLTRLEALRQEENELMRELKLLLSAQTHSSDQKLNE
jgi:hypothetical protein